MIHVTGFLTQAEADDLLSTILKQADFRQYNSGYGVPRPRMEAWYGSWDYRYSGGTVLKAAPIPDWLSPVFEKVKTAGFGDYNAVLINRYRDGYDKVDPHSDDDYGDPFPTIPTLVLGAMRPFWLRLKQDHKTKVSYRPSHGDLLVMRGRTNADWQHWIARTSKPVGERISLTFRKK